MKSATAGSSENFEGREPDKDLERYDSYKSETAAAQDKEAE